jgi:ketosteroid isomerase-like protein
MSDAEAFARRYTAAWCSQDPHRVAAHFADTGWLSVNQGPRATGPAAIAEVAQGFMTTFPDLEVRLERLVETPAALEYHWRLLGTASGGRRVDITGVEAWQLAPDGRIAESRGRFDAADYSRQMGEG